MANLLRKKKYKRLLFSRPTIIIVLLLLFFVSRAAWNVYEKEKMTRAKLSEARTELIELQEREQELSSKLAALDTQEGMESEIRSTYGFAKKGERVLVILEDESTDKQSEKDSPSMWERIMSLFH